MAYDVASRLRPVRPGAAFIEGRDNAQRNALLQGQDARAAQAQDFSQANTLFNQNRATAQDEAAAAESEAALDIEETKQLYSHLSNLAAAPPEQFSTLAQRVAADPIVQKHGITLEDFSDQREAAMAAKVLGGKLGVGPSAPKQAESFTLSPGQQRFGPDGKQVASVAPTPDKPAAVPGRARLLTAAELQAAGFPDGTVAQMLPDGRIDVVNKREGLSAAEQKTVREAKMRMPRLSAAMRRVERLGSAVGALSNNPMFNGGPMDAKILQYRPEGREVMAASAQLMPELTALTRVPGIGSQSDLEARLASLAMPSLEMPPEVNARSQAELVAFVDDLKAAYESLLQGGQAEVAAAPAAAPPTDLAAAARAELARRRGAGGP